MNEIVDRKPVLLSLDMADPVASVRDPAFYSLIERGYTVTAHTAAQRGDRQEWVLLLEPPQPAGPATPHAVSLSTKWQVALVVAIVCHAVLTVLLNNALGG